MIPISPSPMNGLTKESWANAFQVVSASSNRFVKKLGVLMPDQLEDIVSAVFFCIRIR